jgi:hypothetical protein
MSIIDFFIEHGVFIGALAILVSYWMTGKLFYGRYDKNRPATATAS